MVLGGFETAALELEQAEIQFNVGACPGRRRPPRSLERRARLGVELLGVVEAAELDVQLREQSLAVCDRDDIAPLARLLDDGGIALARSLELASSFQIRRAIERELARSRVV